MTARPLGRDLAAAMAPAREAVRVIGLMRSLSMTSSQLELVATHMHAYARSHGLELVEVCRADDAPGRRPAFPALLERLCTGELDALLVPTEQHLSVEADIRESLTWLVAQAGGTVLTMAA
jgi:hypothetical protein